MSAMSTRAIAATSGRQTGTQKITIEHPYVAGPLQRWRMRRALARDVERWGRLTVKDEPSRAGMIWLGRITVSGPWHIVRLFAADWDRHVRL